MDYLLDTTTASFILNGNQSVAARLRRELDASRVYCSVVTEGELLYGAIGMGIGRRREYLGEMSFLLNDLSDILPITRFIASWYAKLRRELEASGFPTPENDIWIAATAQAGNMTLVAHDRHFRRIDHVLLEDWLEP